MLIHPKRSVRVYNSISFVKLFQLQRQWEKETGKTWSDELDSEDANDRFGCDEDLIVFFLEKMPEKYHVEFVDNGHDEEYWRIDKYD